MVYVGNLGGVLPNSLNFISHGGAMLYPTVSKKLLGSEIVQWTGWGPAEEFLGTEDGFQCPITSPDTHV